jgi:hypothetical protein
MGRGLPGAGAPGAGGGYGGGDRGPEEAGVAVSFVFASGTSKVVGAPLNFAGGGGGGDLTLNSFSDINFGFALS